MASKPTLPPPPDSDEVLSPARRKPTKMLEDDLAHLLSARAEAAPTCRIGLLPPRRLGRRDPLGPDAFLHCPFSSSSSWRGAAPLPLEPPTRPGHGIGAGAEAVVGEESRQ